ncbi:MAG TPA: 30S ribosomal protein S3 [Candidatus Woesearchaeota archaeon]|nr:30S ribosomal protein S3 [Candidatus Woesearchaeota archaeon]
MIERSIVSRKKVEFQIQEFIKDSLKGVGLSHSKIQRTPLGEKIIVYASRPGLVIGGGGANIKKLTKQLKKKFGLENPQIEISEVENVNLVASIVAERIASALEKYGTMRFKGIGHKAMADVLASGAKGVEILISGKIPSARARTWRFYQGYIKKCGNAALTLVDTAYTIANLKSGIVGIKVSIMPPDVRLPDEIKFIEEQIEEVPPAEASNLNEEIKVITEADKPTEIEENKEEKEKVPRRW